MQSTGASTTYPKATFTDPTPYGYIYAGFTVAPPTHAPVVRKSKERDDAIVSLTALADKLDALPEVVKATVFRAVFMPPLRGAPRFDVALLIRTTSPETISTVHESEPFIRLGADSIINAHNSRRIGATETFAPDAPHGPHAPGAPNASRSGEQPIPPATYLLNHFTGDDPKQAVRAWESLTGWYTAKVGIDNSTLLRPFDDTPYAVINYVRLPTSAPRFLFNQFRRRSFRTFVRATLRENGLAALPAFFTPVAEATGRSAGQSKDA